MNHLGHNCALIKYGSVYHKILGKWSFHMMSPKLEISWPCLRDDFRVPSYQLSAIILWRGRWGVATTDPWDGWIYIYIYRYTYVYIYIYNMSSHTHGDSVWLAKLVKLDSTAAHGNRLRPSAAKAHTLQVAGSPQVPLWDLMKQWTQILAETWRNLDETWLNPIS